MLRPRTDLSFYGSQNSVEHVFLWYIEPKKRLFENVLSPVITGCVYVFEVRYPNVIIRVLCF